MKIVDIPEDNSKVKLTKGITYQRITRREYVTSCILSRARKKVGVMWVYDDSKLFEDKNAMFQCIKNIVERHPELQEYGVYWEKKLPYVYVWKR